VVVLTGAGQGFCAGGDVKIMDSRNTGAGQPVAIDEAIHRQRVNQRATSGKLFKIPKPTIAALPGAAAGAGLSLALACDLRIMAKTAIMTTAFARVGLSGDYGGTYFLTQLVGAAKARELYFLSDRISAAEALRLGLTSWVVEPEELAARTAEIAARLAKGPTVAYRYMKENLNRAMAGEVDDCLDLEATHHVHCGQTADHRRLPAPSSRSTTRFSKGASFRAGRSRRGWAIAKRHSAWRSALLPSPSVGKRRRWGLRRAMRPKAQKDSAAALSQHTTSAADRAGLVVPVGERRDLRGGALAATVGVQDHLIGHLPGDEEGRSFSKTHGPNVIRRSLGADAPALRAHQHQAPRQYRHPRPLLSPGAPNTPTLVHRHRSAATCATGRPVSITRRAACSQTPGPIPTPSASISRAVVRTPTYVKVHLQRCLDRRINEDMSVGGKRDRNACQVIDPPYSRRNRDGCHVHDINGSLANNVAPQYLIGLAVDNQLAKSEGLPINDSARYSVKVDNCCDNVVALARFPFRNTYRSIFGMCEAASWNHMAGHRQ